ncbi:unnamed protein product [Mytilus coruscus]|uniref:AIG1-type G domain-containing protein n=1 Tax=Mytilus coruscus TaxID=42192 RepID=A0A6J7ZT76_MYTCO|nr:unnamed protein product [Mytilus coruscus]
MEHRKHKRTILFGKSGDEKSSFGNTLIGKQHFKVSALSSVPMPVCETADIATESGRNLKIVETPGIIEPMRSNMLDLVQSHFDFLAPGPNVIIIVLMPRRFSQEDETVVTELFNFFGDDHFLEHTILVMLRKSEIVDDCTNITEYMENTASDSMKILYKRLWRPHCCR